jgi:hypothetical protein
MLHCHIIMETTKPRSVTKQARIVERMMIGENMSPVLVTMMDCRA